MKKINAGSSLIRPSIGCKIHVQLYIHEIGYVQAIQNQDMEFNVNKSTFKE